MNRLFNAFCARLAQFLPGGYSLRPALQRWRGVHIGRGVWISQWVYLDELYPEAITIQDNVTIGLRTSVFSHFHWGPRRTMNGSRPVIIGSDVFIGPHCVILPGIRIGEGAVVKAGTVVTRNVPPRTFFGDSPGRPLARITTLLGPDSSYDEFVRGLRPITSEGTTSAGSRAPMP